MNNTQLTVCIYKTFWGWRWFGWETRRCGERKVNFWSILECSCIIKKSSWTEFKTASESFFINNIFENGFYKAYFQVVNWLEYLQFEHLYDIQYIWKFCSLTFVPLISRHDPFSRMIFHCLVDKYLWCLITALHSNVTL